MCGGGGGEETYIVHIAEPFFLSDLCLANCIFDKIKSFHVIDDESPLQTIKAAIKQFTTIISDYVMVPFPPALYGLGKALSILHRQAEALKKAKEGLKLLPSYHLPSSLTWPGTNEVITEALVQNVEVRHMTDHVTTYVYTVLIM